MKKIFLSLVVCCLMFIANGALAEKHYVKDNEISLLDSNRVIISNGAESYVIRPTTVEELWFKTLLLSAPSNNGENNERILKLTDNIIKLQPDRKMLIDIYELRERIALEEKKFDKYYESFILRDELGYTKKEELKRIIKYKLCHVIFREQLKNNKRYQTEEDTLRQIKYFSYGIDKDLIGLDNYRLGKLYQEAGELNSKYYNNALKEYKRIVKFEGNLCPDKKLSASVKNFCIEYIGDIYFKQKKYDKALNYYDKALEMWGLSDSKDRDFYLERVNLSKLKLYEKLKDYNKTIEVSKRLLVFDNTNWTYYNALGCNYYRLHDYENALESFKKQLELNPSRTSAYNNIALCLMHLGRYDEAMSNVDKALQMDAEVKARYANYDTKADILLHMSKPEEALTWVNKIPQQDFKGSNYYTRGRIYLALGQKEQAKKDIKMAIKLEISEIEDASKILKALDE